MQFPDGNNLKKKIFLDAITFFQFQGSLVEMSCSKTRHSALGP